MHQARIPGRRRHGYTLIELLVVNILMALLVVLIAGAWRAFGPLSVEVIARARIVNEANIAARSLYQDSHAGPLGLTLNQVTSVDVNTLQFNYSDPLLPSNTCIVTYIFTATPDKAMNSANRLTNSVGRLDREVTLAGNAASTMTIAQNVESVVALTPNNTTNQVQYTVTFSYRGFRSQYTFAIHK